MHLLSTILGDTTPGVVCKSAYFPLTPQEYSLHKQPFLHDRPPCFFARLIPSFEVKKPRMEW